MKVFVAGAGIMGLQIATALCEEGNEVTAADIEPDRVERLREILGDDAYEGDCCDPVILERGRLSEHDALLALTGDDEDNLVISFLAKREFGVARVVARINDPRNSWLFSDLWGVDVAMSAPTILLSLVEEATAARPTVNLMDLATAGVRVVEASIGEASPHVGERLADISVPDGMVIATVIRDGHPCVPDGETVLCGGDQLLVVAERAAASRVEELFA